MIRLTYCGACTWQFDGDSENEVIDENCPACGKHRIHFARAAEPRELALWAKRLGLKVRPWLQKRATGWETADGAEPS